MRAVERGLGVQPAVPARGATSTAPNQERAWEPLRLPSERRVLIADDDTPVADVTAALLRSYGWQVDLAHDGQAALEAALGKAYDLLLLDLQMPRVDGLTVLHRIRQLQNPPSVLIMSGHLDAESVRQALRAGAAEILEKPVDARQLITLLHGYGFTPHQKLVSGSHAEHGPAHGEVEAKSFVPELLGDSPEMRVVREQIVNVSRYRDMPVLIIGETGTGKELVAQAIHKLSGRDGSLLAINCAAVPEELFESEVFGHEAGSFTGARSLRVGLFEAAGRGTVFFDEIGEMPATLQAKLLRVLENRSFRRVGSNRTLELEARIVSATNRPLRGRNGDALRPDLFYRLAGFTIRTPALRERMQDVEILARHFLQRFAESYPSASPQISPRAIDALHAHHWPGNVRELRSVIQRAAAQADGRAIGVREVVEALRAHGFEEEPIAPEASEPRAGEERSAGLRDIERSVIEQTYARSGGNLSLAAKQLRIPRTTLRDKLRRYGLR